MKNMQPNYIIIVGCDAVNILPKTERVVIPVEKLVKYALNPMKDPNKARSFGLALGYDLFNADKLIDNIRVNLEKFPAKEKGDKGYGMLYEVVLTLTGENGKTANVLTAWIDDIYKNEMRLVTIHID